MPPLPRPNNLLRGANTVRAHVHRSSPLSPSSSIQHSVRLPIARECSAPLSSSSLQSSTTRIVTPHVQSRKLSTTPSTSSTSTTADHHGSSGDGHAATEGDHGHHEESHYDPPGGYLWGRKPGEKYEKEGWEGPFLWGMGGAFVLMAVVLAYKPDTSIQTWALEEARRRLEVEGVLEDPNPTGEKCGWDESWASRETREAKAAAAAAVKRSVDA